MKLKSHRDFFGPVLDALSGGARRVTVTGLWGAAKALFLSHIAAQTSEILLVVTPTEEAAQALQGDLAFFLEHGEVTAGQAEGAHATDRVLLYPSTGLAPGEVPLGYPAKAQAQIRALHRLSVTTDLQADPEHLPRILVVSTDAVLQPVPTPEVLGQRTLTVTVGERLDRDRIVQAVEAAGYRSMALVVEPGEYALRGGILDVFSPMHSRPVRVEFFDDVVESLREFEPDTQRSLRPIEKAVLLPVCETWAETTPLWAHWPRRAWVVLDETPAIAHHAAGAWEQLGGALDQWPVLALESVKPAAAGDASVFHYQSQSAEALGVRLPAACLPARQGKAGLPTGKPGGSVHAQRGEKIPPAVGMAGLMDRVRRWQQEAAVHWVSPSQAHAQRAQSMFREYGVASRLAEGSNTRFLEYGRPTGSPVAVSPAEEMQPGFPPQPVTVWAGHVSNGFALPGARLILLTEEDVFGKKVRLPAPRRPSLGKLLSSFQDLQVGDFVVHVDHGIGEYRGLARLKVGGMETDFLVLRYAGDGTLYVPLDKLDRVQKYVGEGQAPRLDRLGGTGWERTKARVRKRVREIAQDLVRLYAARQALEGTVFGPDDEMQREFEAAFPYEETPDQMAAIEDVKRDMEQPRPMDRLVCGDVGYGKTEVALRAAFKTVLHGKQVAMLVPTTILAQQHLETFRRRFAPFPVSVEMLSRFRSPREQKAVLRMLAEGTVDIVIGTHRLLQRDVRFRDLGLVVVDEEQRFGVTHKERLKQLRTQVDVLTLSATPIPRTLHMSMLGLRDIAIIETPPLDRLPIQTFVLRFDRRVVREAILRELGRQGQVFVVHNRVQSIAGVGRLIQEIVPEARVAIAHGQMPERELERVMLRFLARDYDVLVSTAIIESGLDIPTVNTLIVNHAERFGLSQLYQLRGRVGRSSQKATAYFLVPEGASLTDVAVQRLRILQEFSELGSGFHVAAKDLEIRGAGNLLGGEQSGHMAAVGYDLYVDLLEQAVAELKGEEIPVEAEPALHLRVSAYLPETYVPDVHQRLVLYKRLASARDNSGLDDLRRELRDRYGPIPTEAKRLLEIMSIKIISRQLGVASLSQQARQAEVSFGPGAQVPVDRVVRLAEQGRCKLIPEATVRISLPSERWEEVYPVLEGVLRDLV